MLFIDWYINYVRLLILNFPGCIIYSLIFSVVANFEIYSSWQISQKFIDLYMHTSMIYVNISASHLELFNGQLWQRPCQKREHVEIYEIIITFSIMFPSYSCELFNLLFVSWFSFLPSKRQNQEHLKQLHVDTFICNLNTVIKKV